MVNFSLTRFTSAVQDSVDDALSAVETQLETVDNTKVIRHIEIVKLGNQTFQGVAIYDT